VIQKIGPVAYKLKLPEDSKVHPVFHASLLKKAVNPNIEPQLLPACMNEDWHLEPDPEEALDTRRNDQREVEVLVKWEGLLEFENSWELADKMRKEFPGFLLERRILKGGIDSYDKVYKRKRGQRDTANH
jgi:hypothetical protein